MPLVTAAQLARIRTARNAAMPDVAHVRRNVTTGNGEGGRTSGWADLPAAYPCWVERNLTRRGGDESSVVQGQFEQSTNWKVVLPALADVTPNDRIHVVQEGGVEREFDVIGVGAESDEPERVAFCEERLSG